MNILKKIILSAGLTLSIYSLPAHSLEQSVNSEDRSQDNIARDVYRHPYETLSFFGWLMGLEPTTLGTTNRCSNQLSYNHRLGAQR